MLPVPDHDLRTPHPSSCQVLIATVAEKFPTPCTASIWMPDCESIQQPETGCRRIPESDSFVDTVGNSAPPARTPRLAATGAGCTSRASSKHKDGVGVSCGKLDYASVSGGDGDGDGSGGSGRPSAGSTTSNGMEGLLVAFPVHLQYRGGPQIPR